MVFIDWIQNNWLLAGGVLYALLSLAGQIVGMVNGPKADKASGVLERMMGLLRGFGIGTYKDEPGSVSRPFKGDTGERIVQVEKIR
jgi:hypothetical protein